jgi:hypothetical protein
MPRERPPLPPEVLYLRRLAARALALVLEHHGLSNIAVKLNPDDPTQALPGVSPGEVLFFEDVCGGRGRVIATVFIDGMAARVIADRADALIRRNHVRDFEPAALGIEPMPGRPDIDFEVDLSDVVEREGELLRTQPQRVLPRTSRPRRAPQVKRALRDWRS